MEIIHENKKIMFWDVSRLWPDHLENIRKIFKKNCEIKFNLKIFKNNFKNLLLEENKSIESLELNSPHYEHINDVILIKNIINFLKSLFKKAGFYITRDRLYTASSFSVKHFFKNFNFFKIKDSIPESLSCYIRESYFGGRCEAVGNPQPHKFIKYLDYIGMYSLCMKENFPIGAGYYSFDLKDLNKPGFYDISYFSKDFYLPILPHRKKIDNKLIFCNGGGRGTFWCEEIYLFLKYGGIVEKIHGAYLFNDSAPVFEGFVNFFEGIREKGGAYKQLGKFFINSFYGRLAFNNKDLKTFLFADADVFRKFSLEEEIQRFSKINDC